MTFPALSLTVDKLGCIRGGRAVFSGLSFAASGGGAVELRGENGSGKSTLLRILAGLMRPAAGTLSWTVAREPAPPVRAYCGHRDPVKTWLSVREHLRFWKTVEGTGDADAAAAALGIGHLLDASGGLLSAGQKRRLALARLALGNAPVWLLDEPTVSLDAAGTALLEALVADHRQRGGLVVVATHTPINLPEAQTVTLGMPAGANAIGGAPAS